MTCMGQLDRTLPDWSVPILQEAAGGNGMRLQGCNSGGLRPGRTEEHVGAATGPAEAVLPQPEPRARWVPGPDASGTITAAAGTGDLGLWASVIVRLLCGEEEAPFWKVPPTGCIRYPCQRPGPRPTRTNSRGGRGGTPRAREGCIWASPTPKRFASPPERD